MRMYHNSEREKISESMLSELQSNLGTELTEDSNTTTGELNSKSALHEDDDEADDTMDMSGFA